MDHAIPERSEKIGIRKSEIGKMINQKSDFLTFNYLTSDFRPLTFSDFYGLGVGEAFGEGVGEAVAPGFDSSPDGEDSSPSSSGGVNTGSDFFSGA